ncbi:hypothetical protein E3N88_28812 [Mikania micrantha]|uniref:Uncharacterized protein n=1 Tax=Mikania micrantha TaxID=192012 RepID=A0A5N6N134_9ASTR|nr:hypothetical protein E3N88_28812 [Mikania micrantha]
MAAKAFHRLKNAMALAVSFVVKFVGEITKMAWKVLLVVGVQMLLLYFLPFLLVPNVFEIALSLEVGFLLAEPTSMDCTKVTAAIGLEVV